MPLLFSATLFLSAALLFFVELMFGSMILPKFGGSPAVWNTCMVFFQGAMLAGYAYAHWVPERIGLRRHKVVHVLLLLVPLFFVPIAVQFDPPGDGSPILWVLIILVVSVGLPFFVLSTTNPLLGKWFAETDHPFARDPYFLYAASNVGSMLALVAYPFVPMIVLRSQHLGLRVQSICWTVGYFVLIGMIAASAYSVWKTSPPDEPESGTDGPAPGLDLSGPGSPAMGLESAVAAAPALALPKAKKKKYRPPASDLVATPPTSLRILRWVGLAFVPSSLMLGATAYFSTDVSPGPMIWVLPLGLYLLSFILVFLRLPRIVHTMLILTLPVLILLQAYLMLSETDQSKIVLVTLHLLTLFVASMVCHGELARDRPDPKYLTAFYLWMSVGGVLGGMFNALAAPLIFPGIAEYPLAMALACLLTPALDLDKPIGGSWREVVFPAVLGVLASSLLIHVPFQFAALHASVTEAAKVAQEAGKAGLSGKELAITYGRPAFFALLHLVMLVLMGWICFRDARAKSATPARLRKRVAIWGLAGLAAGATVQFLAAYSQESPIQIFRWWLEYPLAMAFVCLLVPTTLHDDKSWTSYLIDGAVALVLAVLMAEHLVALDYVALRQHVAWMSLKMQGGLDALHLEYEAPDRGKLATILSYGVPILLCYAWVARPQRFGLGVFAIMVATSFYVFNYDEDTIQRTRSFFGVLKVQNHWERHDGRYVYFHRLLHGTTMHGMQLVEPGDVEGTWKPVRGSEPLTYYHQTGPLGQVFAMIYEHNPKVEQPGQSGAPPIALVGLGTGTTAFYGRPGQEVVFYEIDAKVKAIAENPDFFSYLADARDRGVKLDFVMGDARLSLKKDPNDDVQGRPDHHFRLIAVDAFSSDAIPVHLITYEALELYLQKLAPDGVIAFHISNKFLDLEPVVASLAKQAGLVALVRHDYKEEQPGKAASTWVILARPEHQEKAFGSILSDVRSMDKDVECRTKIREIERKKQGLPQHEQEELDKKVKALKSEQSDNKAKKWYWIHERKHWNSDARADVELWTDDYQNIIGIFMW